VDRGDKAKKKPVIDHQFVILHEYRKQSMKAPQQEIDIAMRRMHELLQEE
jgi:phage-related protein